MYYHSCTIAWNCKAGHSSLKPRERMFFFTPVRLFVADAPSNPGIKGIRGSLWTTEEETYENLLLFYFISCYRCSLSPDKKPFCCLIGEWCCYLERGTISRGGGKKQGRGMWLPGAQSLWWVGCQMPHCPNYPASSVSPPGTNSRPCSRTCP